MAIENFTSGWVETDPNAVLSQTSSTATATALNALSSNETHLYKDLGAGAYPGDYSFKFTCVATSQSSTNGRGLFFSISPILPNVDNGTVVYEQSTRVWWNNGILYLSHWEDGNNTGTASSQASTSVLAVALGSTFYCSLIRTGTNVICRVYSDSGYTTLVDTLTIIPTTKYSHRYAIVTGKMSTGSGATLTFSTSNLDLSAINYPTIYTVANTNTIYANSSNVVIAGFLLDNGTSAKLVYANQELAVLNYTANATQPYFTSPSLANVYASRIQFTNSANLQILNATSSIIASKIVTFIPSPTEKLVHDVTDISQAGNTGSIYYGLTPAITVGDQIIYDTRTSSSYNVFIDSQGYITIDSLNTDANDSFTYRVYESSSQFWGDEATITFIGESGAAPYFSKKIKMYIRVV